MQWSTWRSACYADRARAGLERLGFCQGFVSGAQINPLPNLPVPLGIGALASRWLGSRVGVADISCM